MTASPPVLALGAGVVVLAAVIPWAHRARPAARITGPAHDQVVPVPGWFERTVASLDLPIDPVAAWAAALGVGVVAMVWSALQAPVAVAVLAGLGVALRSGVRAPRHRRRGSGPSDDLLLAVLAAAQASLAAGASLAQALGAAVASSPRAAEELAPVLGAVRAGDGLQPALDRWAASRSETGAGLVADALAIAGTTGASRAAALGAVAETLRDRRARAREVRALAGQARASAVVLVVLPAAFAVLVSAADPAVARFTTATPAGWACVVGGLLLDAAGAWWMAALIRGVW